VACSLTAAGCFRKRALAREADLGLKAGKDGWWSMPCPARTHGKPLRLRVGDYCHIFYTDLGECPEPEVFAALVRLGMPGECLKRPKGAQPAPKTGSEADGKLADTILDIAFGDGSATERLIRVALLAADGELPEGPMVEVFAANLRVSPASIYRATAEVRRSGRKWQASP
jgi:hypothetical protein